MKAYLIWTRGQSKISDLIARRTAQGKNPATVPSHVMWLLHDSMAGLVYHAYARHPVLPCGGWVLWTWQQTVTDLRAKSKMVWYSEVFQAGDARWLLGRCEEKLGAWPYDYTRIVTWCPWNRYKSSHKVTCGEGAAARAYPRRDFCHELGVGPYMFDAISPHDLFLACGDHVHLGVPDDDQLGISPSPGSGTE